MMKQNNLIVCLINFFRKLAPSHNLIREEQYLNSVSYLIQCTGNNTFILVFALKSKQ